MYKIALLILFVSLNLFETKIKNVTNFNVHNESDLVTSMTEWEARITNDRYANEELIWGRPKGLLYGNLPGAGDEQKANLYPDKSCTYFVANIRLSPEDSLTLTWMYPYARYFSFTIANQLGNDQVGNGTFLRGDQIIPDRGSYNPFLSSNERDVFPRNFTLYVMQGKVPSTPRNNTLYTGHRSDKTRIHLSVRIYLADEGFDGTGSVMLNGTCPNVGPCFGTPEVSLDIPGKKTITGPSLVKELRAIKKGDPNGYTIDQWLSEINRSDDKTNAPCLRLPFFQVFWNTDYSVTGAFEAKNPEKRVINHPPNINGGFANNPDTRYMLMVYSFYFGEVVVVRGKMPTHPTTRRGENVLPNNPQVQYFSASTAAAPPSGEGWDGVFDEQIKTDKYGNFTIVVSWPWNRPVNAVIENGVSWLSPGNGEGHYVGARNWIGLVCIRYQNSDPDWKNSPSKIPMPTKEYPFPQDPVTMGPYYPMGEYMSKLEFENVQNRR
jgi:hypothetical protein